MDIAFDEWIVTASDVAEMSDVLTAHACDRFTVVEGGDTRQVSVQNAVSVITSKTVMIHDGARPNVSSDLITAIVERLDETIDGVIPGAPAIDTIKQVDNGLVSRTIPRETLVHVQTPQLFHTDRLRRAYKAATADFTDEAGLMESQNGQIAVVNATHRNLKITSRDDLETFVSWRNT